MYRTYTQTRLVRHPFTLIVPAYQERRLAGTCFRPDAKCSGNFRHWKSVEDILQDATMESLLVAQIQEDIGKEASSGTWSTTIVYPHDWVGWSATAPLSELPSGIALTEFKPNRHTRAQRVADPRFLAPRTYAVTFVIETRYAEGSWTVIIHSCYPGDDIPLGTSHERCNIPPEEAVFFPWEQPGA